MGKDQGLLLFLPLVPVVHPPLVGVEGGAFLGSSLYSIFPSLAFAFLMQGPLGVPLQL